MKIILVTAIFVLSNIAFGRGLNPSSQDFGGIAVPDPNSKINKQSPSRTDIEKARELMAQFGYGQPAKPKDHNSDSTSTGQK